VGEYKVRVITGSGEIAEYNFKRRRLKSGNK